MNYVKFPYLTPFKFVPVTNSPGVHFDDRWSLEQLRDWEMRVFYKQKWQKTDTTTLQVEASMAPDALRVLRPDGSTAKTITWSLKFQATNYAVYELTYDLSDLAEGVYFNYQKVSLGAITWEVVSEPIHMAESWPGTLGFTYKNSFNDWDVAFSTGLQYFFRVEADIPPTGMQPERELVTATSQTRNVSTLSGIPYRTFQLHIGEAPRIRAQGVAPWVLDLLNAIFCCDSIVIENKAFTTESGAKWERTVHKGRPLVAAFIELVEKYNNASLELSDPTPISQHGIITAYEIDTAFFGAGSLIPVTDVEQQG